MAKNVEEEIKQFIIYKSECSKLTQEEYKTKNDWVGSVIHLKLCKRLKFDHIAQTRIRHRKSLMKFSEILSYKGIIKSRQEDQT